MRSIWTGSFALTIVFALSSCASHRVVGDGKATIALTRADISELHEAFKTISEKRFVLPSLGEGTYSDRRCRIPIDGVANVTVNGNPSGTTHVRGTLAFAAPVAKLMLDWMDEAAEEDKDRTQTDMLGMLSCNGKKCVLTFDFPADAEVTVDASGQQIYWKIDKP